MNKKLALIIALVMVVSVCAVLFVACDETYDLTYVSWNLGTEAGNNTERKMIKAFEEEYNVKVKIMEAGAGNNYDPALDAYAARNNMPDVFMTSNIDYVLRNNVAADITEFVNGDASGDWDKIPSAIEQSTHYKSGIYAVPFSMHMMGYFVNVDLLEELNLSNELNALVENFTFEGFKNLVSAVKGQNNGSGAKCIGLSAEDTIIEWYPAALNENYGWFTWDGEQYHLDGSEFATAMQEAASLRLNKLTYDSLNDEDRADDFEGVDGAVQLWDQGRLAIRWGSTYEAPNMLTMNPQMNLMFLGVPGGRTPIVPDYLAISSSCKNKQLAYDFAKWMSFSPKGIMKRIELDNTRMPNTLPLITDDSVIEAYFDKYTSVSGILEKYDSLDKGIVQSVKVVPGYRLARWDYKTGIQITKDGETIENCNIGQLLDACRTGEATLADYANQINAFANQQYAAAVAKYKNYN